MGNAEGHAVKNVDKRTSRRDHRDVFIAAIKRYRERGMTPAGFLRPQKTFCKKN